jgi:hypothetical protein
VPNATVARLLGMKAREREKRKVWLREGSFMVDK